jgi:hypothetical protein
MLIDKINNAKKSIKAGMAKKESDFVMRKVISKH